MFSRKIPVLLFPLLLVVPTNLSSAQTPIKESGTVPNTPADSTADKTDRTDGTNKTAKEFGQSSEIGASKKRVIYSGPTSSKKIALTFDDGPNSKFTPQFVEFLTENQIPATFFLLGENVKANPKTTRLLVEKGFEIGNHSWDHKDMHKLSEEEIRNEIVETQNTIESVAGVRPKLFRPPYGNTNAAVARICEGETMEVINWTLDTNDWREGQTGEKIVEEAMAKTRGGTIILMHDRTTKTLNAVKEMIAPLKSKGYEFCSVSEILAEIERAEAAPTIKGRDALFGDSGNSSKQLEVTPEPAPNKYVPVRP
ncbi:MAG: polysaccharide deacetylase family protein [bacterium]